MDKKMQTNDTKSKNKKMRKDMMNDSNKNGKNNPFRFSERIAYSISLFGKYKTSRS
jgi:hypothetical protein